MLFELSRLSSSFVEDTIEFDLSKTINNNSSVSDLSKVIEEDISLTVGLQEMPDKYAIYLSESPIFDHDHNRKLQSNNYERSDSSNSLRLSVINSSSSEE